MGNMIAFRLKLDCLPEVNMTSGRITTARARGVADISVRDRATIHGPGDDDEYGNE